MATRVRYGRDEAGKKIRVASVSGATIPWPEDHGKRTKPRRGAGPSDTPSEEVSKVTFPGIEEEYLAWHRRRLALREQALGAKSASPYTGVVPMETLLREPFRSGLATPGSVANGELAVKIGSINDPADEAVYAEERAEQLRRLAEYDEVMRAKVVLAGKEEDAELAEPFKYDETRQGRYKRAVRAGVRQRKPMPTLVPDSPLAVGSRARAGEPSEEDMRLVRESLSASEIEELLGADAVGRRTELQRLRDGDDDVTFASMALEETEGAAKRKEWARGVLLRDRERRRSERASGAAEQ